MFCLHYMKYWNAGTAPIKARYSKDSAYIIGHKNLISNIYGAEK
ncbi:terminase small subunit [Acetoanaerobium noterae]